MSIFTIATADERISRNERNEWNEWNERNGIIGTLKERIEEILGEIKDSEIIKEIRKDLINLPDEKMSELIEFIEEMEDQYDNNDF